MQLMLNDRSDCDIEAMDIEGNRLYTSAEGGVIRVKFQGVISFDPIRLMPILNHHRKFLKHPFECVIAKLRSGAKTRLVFFSDVDYVPLIGIQSNLECAFLDRLRFILTDVDLRKLDNDRRAQR